MSMMPTKDEIIKGHESYIRVLKSELKMWQILAERRLRMLERVEANFPCIARNAGGVMCYKDEDQRLYDEVKKFLEDTKKEK